MKTNHLFFNTVFFLMLFGCAGVVHQPVANIREAEALLRSAQNQTSTTTPHIQKAKNYLELAKKSVISKKYDEADLFSLLSTYESRLAIALRNGFIYSEQLKREQEKLEESKKLYTEEKKRNEQLKSQLFK